MSQALEKEYLQNVKKVYFFSFFWMFLITIPVIVPYFLSYDLTMEQVFRLQAIFGLSVAILEVPSGYMCDLLGRKYTMTIGSFISGLGFTALYLAESFNGFVVFEILVGIGASLVSGADISILYDSFHYISDSRVERTKAVANIQFSRTTSESIASIIGGLLVKVSFKTAILANAFTSWIPFVVALTIKEPPYQKMDHQSHLQNIKEILFHLFKKDKLLTLVFLNLIFWGLSTFTAVWIFQKYWLTQNIPLYYFGFIWAGYNLTVGIIGKQVHHFEKKWGPTPLLIVLSLLPVAGYMGMGYFSGIYGIFMGLAFQISRGINQVILKDALNWRTPSHFRATANSLVSLFFRLGFCIIGPIVGYLIDHYSLNFSLQSLGAFFFFVFLFIMLPLVRRVRKLDPDIIPPN